MSKHLMITAVFAGLLFACSNDGGHDTSTGYSDAGDWPVFRGDRNLSGVSPAALPDNPALLWSFDTGSPVASSPVIAHGAVFIGSSDGVLYSVDARTGKKNWAHDTGDDIEAPPMVLDGTVYVGNRDGRFFAVDALTGSLSWSYDTDGEIMGSANHIDIPGGGKHVLVGSYDTKMYCFDAVTGALVWSYETDYYINGAPATDGEHVVFGGCDASLHIVSTADGAKIGEVPVGSYIAGSAALVDGVAYVGHYGGSLVAVDTGGKTVAWEYRPEERSGGFFSSPAVGSAHIYIGSRDRHVHCVERETGVLVWTFRTRGEVDSSPVIAGNGGRIVFGSSDGRIYMVGAVDGAEIWTYEIGSPVIGSAAVAGGMLVIGAQDGRIYAFGGTR